MSDIQQRIAEILQAHLWCSCPGQGGFTPEHAAERLVSELGLTRENPHHPASLHAVNCSGHVYNGEDT